MSRKNLAITAGILVALLLGYFIFKRDTSSEASTILADVKQGEFRVQIETTGELEAKNSVKILGPHQLRNFQIWEVTIQNIISEGTVVKKGDWV
ncbi:MAG TPA: RND transporter, partial [Cyclobacteriaceae bacterium]|nr:RND transporter [Cyclobacteriaceae bacterium]